MFHLTINVCIVVKSDSYLLLHFELSYRFFEKKYRLQTVNEVDVYEYVDLLNSLLNNINFKIKHGTSNSNKYFVFINLRRFRNDQINILFF